VAVVAADLRNAVDQRHRASSFVGVTADVSVPGPDVHLQDGLAVEHSQHLIQPQLGAAGDGGMSRLILASDEGKAVEKVHGVCSCAVRSAKSYAFGASRATQRHSRAGLRDGSTVSEAVCMLSEECPHEKKSYFKSASPSWSVCGHAASTRTRRASIA